MENHSIIRTILFALLLIFLWNSAFSQGWIKQYDVGGASEGSALAELSDGSILLLGRNYTPINTLTIDGFMMYLDPFGTEIWSRVDDNRAYTDLILQGDQSFLASTGTPFWLGTDEGIYKYAIDGQEIWAYENDEQGIIDMDTLPNGHIIGVGVYNGSFGGYPKSIFVELDENGNEVQFDDYSSNTSGGSGAYSLYVDNFVYFVGGERVTQGSSHRAMLRTLTVNGSNILLTIFDQAELQRLVIRYIHKINSNTLLLGMDGYYNEYGSYAGGKSYFAAVNSTSGELLWTKPIMDDLNTEHLSFTPLSNGNILVTANSFYENPAIAEYDLNGVEVWRRSLDIQDTKLRINKGIQRADGTLLFTGMNKTDEDEDRLYPVLIQTDSVGNVYTNIVRGKVFQRDGFSCEAEVDDPPIAGVSVSFEKGGEIFSTVTDSSGNYEILLDTGTYQITLSEPSPFWTSAPCFNGEPLVLDGFYQTTVQDFGFEPLINACPLIHVDITSPFLRRCFSSSVNIQLTNVGAAPVDSFAFRLRISDDLDVLTSTYPYEVIPDSLLFHIGRLEVFDTLQIRLTLLPDCDLPLSSLHCFFYSISTEDSCIFNTPNFDGSNLVLEATCDSTNAIFTIVNTGMDMSMENSYELFGDGIQLDSGGILLTALDTFFLDSNLAGIDTFLLQVNQTENHPGIDLATLQVFDCQTPYFDQISTPDIFEYALPQVGERCYPIIGSFDPNDKILHINESTDSIECFTYTDQFEYTIRFQNTGNDTAFTVRILDTLATSLDLSTFGITGSSHPYQFSLESGRVLNFIFPNILLPDSTTNEPESHGYISFQIDPKRPSDFSSMAQTIQNRAAIYFDFNDPIITEWSLIELCEDPLLTSVRPIEQSLIPNPFQVYPNPTQGKVFVQTDIPFQQVQIEVFNALGQRVQTTQLTLQNRGALLDIEALQSGLYFIHFSEQGQVIQTSSVVKIGER